MLLKWNKYYKIQIDNYFKNEYIYLYLKFWIHTYSNKSILFKLNLSCIFKGCVQQSKSQILFICTNNFQFPYSLCNIIRTKAIYSAARVFCLWITEAAGTKQSESSIYPVSHYTVCQQLPRPSVVIIWVWVTRSARDMTSQLWHQRQNPLLIWARPASIIKARRPDLTKYRHTLCADIF